MFTARSLTLGLIAVIRFVVNAVGLIAVLAYVAIFVLAMVHAPKIQNAVLVVRMEHVFAPSIRSVSSWFGWHWPATTTNFAPLILAAAAGVVKQVLDNILARIDLQLRSSWTPAPARAQGKAGALGSDRYKLSAESESDRALLLKRYREIEDALQSTARKSCTFVSIDVVGSTEMKRGERETAIAATFQAYEEMVRHIFAQYRVWKQTWTPDGVMACFLDRDLAMAAAQQVLMALEAFNASENQLRTPIKVRCGLNEGEVVIFEDSALEKVADHAIDVAGHMQKHASEDALQIGDAVHARLASSAGFAATGRSVDGYATFEWTPKSQNVAVATQT